MWNYEEIKPTSKKGQQLYENYLFANNTELMHCYKTYSREKDMIFNDCIKEMKEQNGFCYCIPSYNINIFTFAFRTYKDLYYITPSHNYIIKNAFED